jgi:hypothetical protein
MAERAERVIHSPKGLVIFAHPDGADYARMMQLRKPRWMGTQIIQLRGGRREARRHPVTRRADAPTSLP